MKKIIKIIIGIITLIFIYNFLFDGGLEDQVQKEVYKIEKRVALDAEKQYSIAKKNGSKMDAYIHAGLVAVAYLQVNDEKNYKKWKIIENKEAKIIGL